MHEGSEKRTQLGEEYSSRGFDFRGKGCSAPTARSRTLAILHGRRGYAPTVEERTPYPFRFECRRTGNCCARPGGMVRVTPRDIHDIATHLDRSEAQVRAMYLDSTGQRLRDAPGGACVFLDRGQPAACRIHPVRPDRCRSWPFWPELLDPVELGAARRFCPGIRPGRDEAD